MSAKHKGSILFKAPNQLVVPDVLTNFLKSTTSCAGLAAATTIDGVSQVMVHRVNLRDFDMDIAATQKSMEALGMGVYAGHYPDQFNEEDCQPWELFLNSKNKPAAVVFIDGTFTGFADPTSTHSEEYHYVHKYLGTKLHKIYTDFNNDIGKFIEHMNTDPMIKMEITAMAGIHPMSMLILGENGKYATFGSWDELAWGLISKSTAIVAASPQPAVEQKTEPAATGFAGFAKKKPVTSAEQTPAPAPHPQPEPAPVVPPKTDTAIPQPVVETAVMSPPDWVNTNGKLRDWYMSKSGGCPVNFKERPPVVVHLNKLSKKELDLLDSREERAKAKNVVTKQEVSAPVAQVIPMPKTEQVPTSEMTAFQKIVGASGELPKNPLNIQAEEQKWDSWADIVKKNGILIPGLEAMFNWSDDLLTQHVIECPELTVTLIKDLRRLVIANYTTKEQQQTQQTPPAAEPAPAATGFGGFTKKKATG